MEFFSKVARPPILAGRLLAGVGRERCESQKPRKGKEQGAAMGPTNLDVTADAAHLSAHLSRRVGSGKEQKWQELADSSRAFHPTGPASGRLGL